MKIKSVKFGIKSAEQGLTETKSILERLSKGENVKPKDPEIYFVNLNVMRKMITDERLKILRAIKKEKPKSVYELAKKLKRSIKNVHDDVNFLNELGLLKLEKSKEGREKNIPKVKYDNIIIEISV